MNKYKVSVSKDQKKYSIVLNAYSDVEAREKIHKEGYSILNVEEISKDTIEGNKFIFEAQTKSGATKKGKVIAKDPFKIYVKLRDGLDYSVISLYSEKDKNITEEKKLDLILHLEEQYNLYKSHKNKNKSSKQKKEDIVESKKNLENFYLKKELDETYRLIDFVLLKLKNILEKADLKDVDEQKKENLKTLYNSIIKVKKSTNISKLKEIGELALIKIGKIELSVLEKNKDSNSKKLLRETNSLLKKVGSNEQFIEKSKDIKYIISQGMSELKTFFKELIPSKTKKSQISQGIDKESSSYWKTEILISQYEKRQTENGVNIFKNILKIFLPTSKNKTLLEDLFIKRKVITQNLTILRAKKTGKLVSYTKLVKGYYRFIEYIIAFLKYINDYIIAIIYAFSVSFVFFLVLQKVGVIELHLNVNGIFAFIYFILISMLIRLTSGLATFVINIVFFIFILIFGVVNF